MRALKKMSLTRLRGFLLAVCFFGALFSCDGQTRINGNKGTTPIGQDDWRFENGMKGALAQIDSLKIEVGELEKTIESRNLQIAIFQAEINQSKEEVVTLTAEVVSKEAELVNVKESLALLENELGEAQTSLNERNVEVTQLKNTITSLEESIDGKNAEIVVLGQKILEVEGNLKTAQELAILWEGKYNELLANPNIVHDTIYQERIIVEVPPPHIDTIVTVSDVIILDFTDSLVKPTIEPAYYVMVTGIGLVLMQDTDTSYTWQRHWEIERKVDYAELDPEKAVTYRNLGVPFQIRSARNIETTSTSLKIQVYTTEQCKIQYTMNTGMPPHSASSENFDATKISDIEYRHTRVLDGLEPNTDYFIQIWVTSEKGHVDLWNLREKTQ